MELKLSLSLSSSSSSSSSCLSQKFDLNDYSHESIQGMEDLKKRKLCVNYDDESLPILFCNKHDDDEDDDDDDVNEVQSTFIFINHKNGGEGNGVVGWPPVKSSRKKVGHQTNHNSGGGESKSMYVKVYMEGDGIARKIDLNLHHSYRTLVHTLAKMFDKCNEDVKLTYQDKEGDWLLAGDVPWGSFIETVQRLKLRKSNC